MARGFDSKSVSDQQEEAERRAERRGRGPVTVPDPRVRKLESARTDARARLRAAEESGNERMAQMLRGALEDVEAELARAVTSPAAKPVG